MRASRAGSMSGATLGLHPPQALTGNGVGATLGAESVGRDDVMDQNRGMGVGRTLDQAKRYPKQPLQNAVHPAL